MDTEPFFTWDVLKHDPALAVELMTILQKSKFTPQLVRTYDEDEPPDALTDRGYWESRGTKETLQATDELLNLVNSIEPRATLKYNKYYIGLEIDGSPRNFVVFRPQKKCVLMGLRLPRTT